MDSGITPAERLFKARKALGLTTSEMAEAVGLKGTNAKDDFRKMEKGLREPSGPVLVAAEAMVRVFELERELSTYAIRETAKREF